MGDFIQPIATLFLSMPKSVHACSTNMSYSRKLPGSTRRSTRSLADSLPCNKNNIKFSCQHCCDHQLHAEEDNQVSWLKGCPHNFPGVDTDARELAPCICLGPKSKNTLPSHRSGDSTATYHRSTTFTAFLQSCAVCRFSSGLLQGTRAASSPPADPPFLPRRFFSKSSQPADTI